jgi:hypothetical protein
LIKDADKVRVGDKVITVLHRGRLVSRVEEIDTNNEAEA